jgi:hypothetical protein
MGRDKHFVVMFVGAAHVRFGSEADIAPAPRHVRFTPESGHQLSALGCPRFVPIGDIVRRTD